jgi:hypothetical protein
MSAEERLAGESCPRAATQHGTQVLYRWVKWLSNEGFHGRNPPVAIFTRAGTRLVVHAYAEALCGVLTITPQAPKLRGFREWRQPLAAVRAKLLARGWKQVAGQEAGDVAH